MLLDFGCRTLDDSSETAGLRPAALLTFVDIRRGRLVLSPQRRIPDLHWQPKLPDPAFSLRCVASRLSTHKSSRQVWQTPLIFAHVVHTSVFLNRAPAPGFQRKTVNGRLQIYCRGSDVSCDRSRGTRHGLCIRSRTPACSEKDKISRVRRSGKEWGTCHPDVGVIS